MSNTRYPPLLLKYLKMFQEDPSSRIFAPLAESYRKIGLIDEAIEICREGLTLHPTFVGGKVAYARALFDKKNYAEVRVQLAPVIDQIPDNLVAQKLLADSALALGLVNEALSSYKMLLYFNPRDPEVANLVQELETAQYESGESMVKGYTPQKFRRLVRLRELLDKVQKSRSDVDSFTPV